MLNQIPVDSISRNPRGIITINGTQVEYISLEVNTTTYFLADTFSAILPMSGQPSGFGVDYFSRVPAIMVEIFFGFPGNLEAFSTQDLTSVILGQVDQVDMDWLNKTITLSGRDLTAKFIDNKTTQKYPNLTASQIVEKLAKKEGLSSQVTPTNTPVGVFYGNDHATLTSQLTEWDLLTYLAKQENYIVYVEGTTVYFKPQPQPTDTPYVLQYNTQNTEQNYPVFNADKLETNRSLTVARDVIVVVRSWNRSAKKAFQIRVKSTPNKKTALAAKAQPIGDAQVFSYVIPNLTKEQALQKAQQIIKQLTLQERKIEFELPADMILQKISVIKLTGTNTDYDQIYFTDSINRVLSVSDGFKMMVRAKNHSPNSEVVF